MNRCAPVVRWSVVAGLVVVVGALASLAGPLDPPAGPVAPTGKTLAEVEPRIAVNATNTPGDNDATPSLFKIAQPGSYYLTGNIAGVAGRHGIEIAASGVTLDLMGFDLVGVVGSLDGVSVTVNSLRNITLLNGSVRGWGDEGVHLNEVVTSNCRVEGVLANANSGHGISVGYNCTVTGCGAYFNGGTGFVGAQACAISRCAAYQNIGDGFSLTDSANVASCIASFNGASGIVVGTSCLVTGCTSLANSGDGIRCSFGSHIFRNACRQNGNAGDGAGIHVFGGDSRIEDNNCSTADRGIDVDAGGNIIIRNTCAGNVTDWDIVANNVFGPIIDRRAPASASVAGFSAASTWARRTATRTSRTEVGRILTPSRRNRL